MNPQIRSKDYFQEHGYLVGSVEQIKRFPDKKKPKCDTCDHQPQIMIRSDLFGVFDLLAVHPNRLQPNGMPDIVLIQTTSETNHYGRRNKVLSAFETKLVLMAGIRVLVQSWRQNKDTQRWRPFDEWITLADFEQAPHYPSDMRSLLEIRRKARKKDLPVGATLFDPTQEEAPF